MNAVEENGQRHEIIIVRRAHNGEDEGHHGGVWKIAFADFMTAMMCFFLVMWLINAANEETRAALASYFNPVKLVDRNASSKGLHKLDAPQSLDEAPEDSEDTSVTPSVAPAPAKKPEQPGNAGPRSDRNLFADPYAVLAEIAADTGLRQNTSDKGDGGAQAAGPATGASGGESYRDPFSPDFWSKQIAVPALEGVIEEETAAEAAEAEKTTTPAVVANEAAEARLPPEAPPETEPATEQPKEQEAIAAAAPKTAPEEAVPPPQPDLDEANKAADAIRQEITKALGENEELPEGISVAATERGVVISITDLPEAGMFEIGSAVPRRELVIAMEKIGRILGTRKGSVVINGHTDGRPFKSEAYDNWRLSTARAHSAYFMLVRGGLDEQRIMEVAGFADRKLKIAEDPLADANRRIEILLEDGG